MIESKTQRLKLLAMNYECWKMENDLYTFENVDLETLGHGCV